MTVFNIACIILTAIIIITALFNDWDTLITVTFASQFIAFNFFIKEITLTNNVPLYFGCKLNLPFIKPTIIYQVTFAQYATLIEAVLIVIWIVKLLNSVHDFIIVNDLTNKIKSKIMIKNKEK